MDFEYYVSRIVEYIVTGDNVFFILYSIATCLLTELIKKIFVNKAKVDILHKFDFAVILPFIFGFSFAVLDVYVVDAERVFNVEIVWRIAISSVTIGAFASTMFKSVKALSGQSLANLMKDDVFGVFYTQLLYFGNIRQQLADKKLTMKDFVNQVKLIAANAQKIYSTEDSAEVKRTQLSKLLNGILDEQSIAKCISALNDALISYIEKK